MASSKANKKRRQSDALQAYLILGNGEICCASCGNDDMEVLEIDHKIPINRNKHGLKKQAGDNLKRWIIKEHSAGTDVRQQLQILCANCHLKKTRRERREQVEAKYSFESTGQHPLPF